MLYPSSRVLWRANSVILINGTDFRTVVPAVSLLHFPINAPVLISNHANLSEGLFREIARVNPSGNESPAQIILVGQFRSFAITSLHQRGYSTLHFNHRDPLVQSLHVAEWRK